MHRTESSGSVGLLEVGTEFGGSPEKSRSDRGPVLGSELSRVLPAIPSVLAVVPWKEKGSCIGNLNSRRCWSPAEFQISDFWEVAAL